MQVSRISLAVDSGLFTPPDGRIALFRPNASENLSILPKEDVEVIQGFRPDNDAWRTRGYKTAVAAQGDYSSAIVFMPRSKALARDLVFQASNTVVKGGPIAVDGQKSDGVESLLKELRGLVPLSDALAKAHGKIAVFMNPGAKTFTKWSEGPMRRLSEGYFTRVSAFSADEVDPGSAALAAVLPDHFPAHVADFGAGWGYLTSQALKRSGIEEIHLVEAEHDALEAAHHNIRDPRAKFHWADVTNFQPEKKFGAILMNPPFHRGRNADPSLGRAFIHSAHRALLPNGALWLVANRHLPYEQLLNEKFREIKELSGPPAYKLYRATGPKSGPRTKR